MAMATSGGADLGGAGVGLVHAGPAPVLAEGEAGSPTPTPAPSTTPNANARRGSGTSLSQSPPPPPASLGFSVHAVVPAAGQGLRTGLPTPKQFWMINERPLLFYTLETLDGLPWLDRVIVPVAADRLDWLEAQASVWGFAKVQFVLGSTTRHRSIKAGLDALAEALREERAGITTATATPHSSPTTSTTSTTITGAAPPENPSVTIIHDVVRPFVDEQTLRAVAEAAHEHGAAGTSRPLVSTVIKVSPDGFLDHSLDRTQYCGSQTPQAFHTVVIRKAYSHCTAYDFDHGTECLHLALEYGKTRAKIVECGPNLWKVTHKPDIYAAELMIKERIRQVAIVTGGGRGIGRDVAIGLSNRGVSLVVVARTAAEVAEVGKLTGAVPVVADVSDPQDVARVFATVIEHFGRLDIVVNNAGSAVQSRLEHLSDQEWDRIMAGNLSSTFYCCREAVQTMKRCGRGGVIVNVGSSSTRGGRLGQGAYSASKAGIQCLTETLALEGMEDGILAYCVVPRRTDTALRHTLYPDEDKTHLLKPSQVANIIVSTATDAKPWLSGQAFWVR